MRGRNYLKDKKKVAAPEPMFSLAAVDHVELDAPTFHIARYLPSMRCAALVEARCVERPSPSRQHERSWSWLVCGRDSVGDGL